MFEAFSNFSDFSGRSARSEFWLFQLLNLLVFIVLAIVVAMGMVGGKPSGFGIGLLVFWAVITVVPQISVTVRRFHDHDLSGWWYLGFFIVGFIPYVGIASSLLLLWIFIRAGTPGSNRFGPDPINPWRGVSAFS
jgi:uncharacterized membrane protein YhaH (DUF805 family)